MARKPEQTEEKPQAVAVLPPSRLPIVPSLAREFDVTADQWRVLIDQIFPNAKTVAAVGMALSYCRARNLDIYKRPVHIVPMWSTALGKMVETVWPGIAEIRTTAHRTGNYAGIDRVVWGDVMERDFIIEGEDEHRQPTKHVLTVEFPEFAAVTVYRMVEGERRAFTAEVFWEESYATQGKSEVPNTMWQKRPRGQLAKCAEAAALRMAFPEELGNTYVAEEMEGRAIDLGATSVAAAATRPALPEPDEPPKPGQAKAEADQDDLPEVDEPPRPGEKVAQPVLHNSDHPEGAENEVRTPDGLLADLAWWLDNAADEAGINEVWSELDVESEFSSDPARMGKAIDLKIAAVQRVEQKAGAKVLGARTDEEQAAIDRQIDDLFPGARGA